MRTDKAYFVGGPLHGTIQPFPPYLRSLSVVTFPGPNYSLNRYIPEPLSNEARYEVKCENTYKYYNTRMQTKIGVEYFDVLVFQ